jgi:hypothetical protein
LLISKEKKMKSGRRRRRGWCRRRSRHFSTANAVPELHLLQVLFHDSCNFRAAFLNTRNGEHLVTFSLMTSNHFLSPGLLFGRPAQLAPLANGPRVVVSPAVELGHLLFPEIAEREPQSRIGDPFFIRAKFEEGKNQSRPRSKKEKFR